MVRVRGGEEPETTLPLFNWKSLKKVTVQEISDSRNHLNGGRSLVLFPALDGFTVNTQLLGKRYLGQPQIDSVLSDMIAKRSQHLQRIGRCCFFST